MLAWPMPAGELGGNWVYADVASMPAVRRAASPYVRRSRDVSALRELRSRGQARRGRSFLSTARSPMRRLLAGAASRLCIRRVYLLRLRILFLVLRLVGRACEAVCRSDERPPEPDLGQPGYRS